MIKTHRKRQLDTESIEHLADCKLIEEAVLNNQHLEYINSASQLDLLVLDDFGLMPLDPSMCRNLFELINA